MNTVRQPRAADLEGDLSAWRNLLWDSVRMMQAGRPDLASRFGAAAREIERHLQSVRAIRLSGPA